MSRVLYSCRAKERVKKISQLCFFHIFYCAYIYIHIIYTVYTHCWNTLANGHVKAYFAIS